MIRHSKSKIKPKTLIMDNAGVVCERRDLAYDLAVGAKALKAVEALKEASRLRKTIEEIEQEHTKALAALLTQDTSAERGAVCAELGTREDSGTPARLHFAKKALKEFLDATFAEIKSQKAAAAASCDAVVTVNFSADSVASVILDPRLKSELESTLPRSNELLYVGIFESNVAEVMRLVTLPYGASASRLQKDRETKNEYATWPTLSDKKLAVDSSVENLLRIADPRLSLVPDPCYSCWGKADPSAPRTFVIVPSFNPRSFARREELRQQSERFWSSEAVKSGGALVPVFVRMEYVDADVGDGSQMPSLPSQNVSIVSCVSETEDVIAYSVPGSHDEGFAAARRIVLRVPRVPAYENYWAKAELIGLGIERILLKSCRGDEHADEYTDEHADSLVTFWDDDALPVDSTGASAWLHRAQATARDLRRLSYDKASPSPIFFQAWRTAEFLGPDGQSLYDVQSVASSFIYEMRQFRDPSNCIHSFFAQGHCGLAWGTDVRTLKLLMANGGGCGDVMRALPCRTLGHDDSSLARALLQSEEIYGVQAANKYSLDYLSSAYDAPPSIEYDHSHFGEWTASWKAWARIAQKLGIRTGAVGTRIQHHWHGSEANRMHDSRMALSALFDPMSHMERDEAGNLRFSDALPPALRDGMRAYFSARDEDGVSAFAQSSSALAPALNVSTSAPLPTALTAGAYTSTATLGATNPSEVQLQQAAAQKQTVKSLSDCNTLSVHLWGEKEISSSMIFPRSVRTGLSFQLGHHVPVPPKIFDFVFYRPSDWF